MHTTLEQILRLQMTNAHATWFSSEEKEPPVFTDTKTQEYAQIAQEAGFRGAIGYVSELQAKVGAKARAAIASEHYRFIQHKDVEAFNKRLRRATEKRDRWGDRTFMELVFVQPAGFEGAPPVEVLAAAKLANERGCFTNLQVAFIALRRETRPRTFDPILFGRVSGDSRLWLIAQWGDDVKIEDIAEAK